MLEEIRLSDNKTSDIEEKENDTTFSVYEPHHVFETLKKFYSRIPKNKKGRDQYVKYLKFSKGEASIFNISNISADSARKDGKKIIQIVATDNQESKPLTCAKFATLCEKVFKGLESLPEDLQAEYFVELKIDGKEKDDKFRFFYDKTMKFAILVNGTAESGLRKFLDLYEGDLATAVVVKKPIKKSKVAKEDGQKPSTGKKRAKRTWGEVPDNALTKDSFIDRIRAAHANDNKSAPDADAPATEA